MNLVTDHWIPLFINCDQKEMWPDWQRRVISFFARPSEVLWILPKMLLDILRLQLRFTDYNVYQFLFCSYAFIFNPTAGLQQFLLNSTLLDLVCTQFVIQYVRHPFLLQVIHNFYECCCILIQVTDGTLNWLGRDGRLGQVPGGLFWWSLLISSDWAWFLTSLNTACISFSCL